MRSRNAILFRWGEVEDYNFASVPVQISCPNHPSNSQLAISPDSNMPLLMLAADIQLCINSACKFTRGYRQWHKVHWNCLLMLVVQPSQYRWRCVISGRSNRAYETRVRVKDEEARRPMKSDASNSSFNEYLRHCCLLKNIDFTDDWITVVRAIRINW